MSLAIIMGMMSCKDNKTTEELQVKVNRVDGTSAFLECTYNQSASDGYAIMVALNEKMTDEMRSQLIEHYNEGKASHASKNVEATDLITGKIYHVYCVTFKKVDGNVTFGEAKELTFKTEPENANSFIAYDLEKGNAVVDVPESLVNNDQYVNVSTSFVYNERTYIVAAKVTRVGIFDLEGETNCYDATSGKFICPIELKNGSATFEGYIPDSEKFIKYTLDVTVTKKIPLIF